MFPDTNEIDSLRRELQISDFLRIMILVTNLENSLGNSTMKREKN